MIEDIQAAIPLGFFLSFMIGPVFFVLLETSIVKGFRADNPFTTPALAMAKKCNTAASSRDKDLSTAKGTKTSLILYTKNQATLSCLLIKFEMS